MNRPVLMPALTVIVMWMVATSGSLKQISEETNTIILVKSIIPVTGILPAMVMLTAMMLLSSKKTLVETFLTIPV